MAVASSYSPRLCRAKVDRNTMFVPIDIHFNTVLGFTCGLLSIVVGLATMLLVLWQGSGQRNNLFMASYMATVTTWGLAGFLLSLAVKWL